MTNSQSVYLVIDMLIGISINYYFNKHTYLLTYLLSFNKLQRMEM